MIWDPDCQGPCECPGEEVAQPAVDPRHRCYCHDTSLPHVHTLGDHQTRPTPLETR